jgi:anti-anti-sigma factor
MTADHTATGAVLALEGELTIYTAAATLTKLREYLLGRTQCTLDLTAVSEIDSAGLQLLLWTRRAATEQGANVHLRGVSPPVAQVLDMLQLEPGLSGYAMPEQHNES